MNDKTKHVIVGAAIGMLAIPLSFAIGLWWSFLAIFIAATMVFVGKEEYDVYKPQPTGFDKMDFLADYLGLICGYIISFMVYYLIQIIQI